MTLEKLPNSKWLLSDSLTVTITVLQYSLLSLSDFSSLACLAAQAVRVKGGGREGGRRFFKNGSNGEEGE